MSQAQTIEVYTGDEVTVEPIKRLDGGRTRVGLVRGVLVPCVH